jgi:hypothetical protein
MSNIMHVLGNWKYTHKYLRLYISYRTKISTTLSVYPRPKKFSGVTESFLKPRSKFLVTVSNDILYEIWIHKADMQEGYYQQN